MVREGEVLEGGSQWTLTVAASAVSPGVIISLGLAVQ